MTDFRALCIELTDCLHKADWPPRYKHVFEQWICIAHKALMEADGPAVPEGREPASVISEPSDEELHDIWDSGHLPSNEELANDDGEQDLQFLFTSAYYQWLEENPEAMAEHKTKCIRAVFNAGRHWGNCQGSLTSSVDRARAALAEPKPEEPTNEELYDYWISTSPEFGCADPIGFARAVLARWGSPAPQPPADGEVAELVEWLREQLHVCLQAPWTPGIKHFGRAANLLERLSPPVPVPVSEQLPGPGDCDAEGRCWVWWKNGVRWVLDEWTHHELREGLLSDHVSHWLPAHAIPIPTAND